MLTPAAAIASVFRKYVDFTGRAVRSEYWWFGLLVWLVSGVLSGLQFVPTGTNMYGDPAYNLGLVTMALGPIVFAGLILPTLAVLVRRLHDANFSGWFALLGLIPIIGGVILFVLTVLPSNPEGARFDVTRLPKAAGLSVPGTRLS
jgi:uncharacterized membrane protein YhaH (DUF805 family)